MIKNEGKGSIWYGMHFYPGVAQYQEENKDPYRVFLNEDTIRAMDSSFAGRPVFVLHVDGVESDINELKKEADGWVIESFYNSADGKHWAKFIVVSDRAIKAIANGMKLSNCYIPKRLGAGGDWNGLEYDKRILDAEYEHLAIVPNPRYVESVIMNPEEFKQYNEDKINELKKLANENDKKLTGESKMKLSWFKKAKVENSADFESMSVLLPKCQKEVSVLKLINDADEKEMKKDEPMMANGDHHVEVDGEKMKVNDLVEKYKDAMQKIKDAEDKKDVDEDEMEDKKEDDDEMMDSDDDEDAKEKALQLAEHEEKEIETAKKKNEVREKAERLKNANKFQPEEVTISLSIDRVARGKSLYGSN